METLHNYLIKMEMNNGKGAMNFQVVIGIDEI